MPGLSADLVIDYYNRRIKVMNFRGPFEVLNPFLKELADLEKMGKIIVYTPSREVHALEACGYEKEGMITGYFAGEDCHIFSTFPEKSRKESPFPKKKDRIVEECLKKSGSREKNGERRVMNTKINTLPEGYVLRPADEADVPAMAALYSRGFQLYPSPLHKESYLLEAMGSGVFYLVIEKRGKIVSLASAETEPSMKNAELTDCLTIPEERGKGHIKSLILSLENELAARNFKSLYTLCRAPSPGINGAFSSLGYAYTGRLVNNCKIMEGFEDMNIWCKLLR
ncbi:putative beta-lysine N-acetyltransferase [Methanosarcina sp. Mfa9]|uniref:putative beta-lysine N-acetyltransferase n=1 Tax=Methanosarcina sp. Mfa9 TaxID=3439063 RepID=UPI003F86DC78